MNVSPVHVLTVEPAWMEFTALLVFVQACSMGGVAKVFYFCSLHDLGGVYMWQIAPVLDSFLYELVIFTAARLHERTFLHYPKSVGRPSWVD